MGFGGTCSIDLYLSASNVYLLIAEELGLIGLGPSLMGVLFACAWRRMGKDSDLEAVLPGLAGGLLGAIVGGLADHHGFDLDFPHSVSPLWLCVQP